MENKYQVALNETFNQGCRLCKDKDKCNKCKANELKSTLQELIDDFEARVQMEIWDRNSKLIMYLDENCKNWRTKINERKTTKELESEQDNGK